jgi:glycosyltransferase involved in cell wall biosynthesis
MRVLMISTDRKIFEEGSDVRLRMIEYGKLFDEMHVVVFRRRIKNLEYGILNKIKLSDNVFIYSTNSISRILYILDAVRISRQIIQNSKFPRPTASAGLGKIHDSVITCQDPFETGFAGWLIARKFKIKLQLQIHTDFLSPYFVKHSVFNKIRVKIAKFLLTKADCIRVVSGRIKDSIVSKFQIPNSKFYLLPIFVDIEKVKNAPVTINLHKKYPQFNFIILMAGRLEKEKNIPLALSAMKEVVKKHPKTGLIIIGNGTQNEALKLQTTNYKLQANIAFEGWKDNDTLISYYKTADLLLVTSYYEGYGMTIIEALATGLFVLSTDVGIAREAGAEIIEQHYAPESIVKNIIDGKKIGELKNYPYKNKADYLEKFKRTFLCAS